MKFITKEKYEKIILPNFSVVVAGPKDLKKDLVCHSYLSYIINRYEIFEFLFVGVGVLLVNALFYIIERISCKKND